MAAPDMEVIKEIPGYKVILKAVLKSQIQQLVEQLSSATNEESIILTASVADGTLSHLGSDSAKGFLKDHEDVKSQFLGYCLQVHHRKSQEAELEKARDHTEQAYLAMQQTARAYVSQTQGRNRGRGKNQGRGALHPIGRALPRARHQPYARPDKKPGTTSNFQSVPDSDSTVDSLNFLLVKQEPKEDSDQSGGDCGSVRSSQSVSPSHLNVHSGDAGDRRLDLGTDDHSRNDSEVDDANNGNVSKDSFVDPNVSVKTESLGDADNDLELTGVELRTGSVSQDWGGDVSMGMNFDTSGATGSQADMTGQQGYNAATSVNQASQNGPKTSGISLQICAVCEKVFPCRPKLIRHMVVHTKDKPYKCACGKEYSDISSLRRHHRSSGHGDDQISTSSKKSPMNDVQDNSNMATKISSNELLRNDVHVQESVSLGPGYVYML